jgi:adenylate cyclase
LKRHLARIVLGLAITLLFVAHASDRFEAELIDRFDSILYDARLRLTMTGKGDRRVVILDIDEKSLSEIGRWPWSRDLVAKLMDELFDRHRVAVVGFDIVWAEPDTSSGARVLDALAQKELKGDAGFQSSYRQLRGKLDFDGMLAASLKGRPVVLGHYLVSEDNAIRTNAIPAPVLPKGALSENLSVYSWRGYTGNLPVYVANAAGGGHLNPVIDIDGVVRRVPMLAELDGAYYESFSLAVARTWLSLESPDRKPPEIGLRFPQGDASRVESLLVGRLTIPVDENAAAIVPYVGKRFSYPYVSAADVLAARVKPGELKDKIVLIGTTALGLLDMRSTPVESVYPGVEAHANLVAGIINGQMKRQPTYVVAVEILLLLVGGVGLSLLLPLLSPLWGTVAVLAALAAVVGVDLLVWTRFDTVLPLANAVLMIGAIYITSMAYGFFVESRSKRQFTELFGQYVPPELVDRMAEDPQKYSMEPRAAELTILFSDVRGFTSISEALKPEDLREYINDYLTDMSGIIRARYRGTLDKYIGDAIMAFWGAPVEDPQHARNGVLAALYMQKECEVLNAKFAARGWPELRIGVGLNTGQVRVGDMGSQVRRAYTVMGDAVNIASRLEGRTKHYGIGILVGEATRDAVKDVLFREIDVVKVKGKDKALTIYEPIGLEAEVGEAARKELESWNAVLRAYRAQRWDEAEALLSELKRMNPACGLYEEYSGFVAGKRRNPPPADWDGVTSFDEK